MSTLKSILHHYNKTTKTYDKLHPETESAQVTDWDKGIVNTLASTALGSLVNTLTSDSLFASMIKKVLSATGVKYNIANTGYICFGSFFGGLIIQWGSATISSGANFVYFNYPVTFSAQAGSVVLTHMNKNYGTCHASIYLDSRSRCALFGEKVFDADTKFYIVAIGV